MVPRSSGSQHQSFLTDWASQSVRGPPYPAHPRPLRFWRKNRLTPNFFQPGMTSPFDSGHPMPQRSSTPTTATLPQLHPGSLPATRSYRRYLRPNYINRDSPLGPTFPTEKPCRGRYINIKRRPFLRLVLLKTDNIYMIDNVTINTQIRPV